MHNGHSQFLRKHTHSPMATPVGGVLFFRSNQPPQNGTSNMKKALPVIVTLLLGVNIASASLVIQNFNDISDASLTNNIALTALDVPGGVSFTTGYEQTLTSVVVARTNDLSVTLTNYVSGQSATAQHWGAAATPFSSGAARRNQTRSTPTMSGTIWFSFLASLNNPNGDVALTLNGTFDGSGRANIGSGGMRVGLGSYTVAGLRGALGVGPLSAAGAPNQEGMGLQLITNSSYGSITAAGFVPTNGTAGLVLGCVDNSGGFQRVRIWYNPDVTNEASLPAPTLTFTDTNSLFVPLSITRIGYQVVRSATLGGQNEGIDNIKVSDEVNAFDIVYLNASLALPTVSVVGTVLNGGETGPTNIVFTITTAAPVGSALTVNYKLSGVATNGFDGVSSFVGADYTDTNFNTGTQISSVTIPPGGSNAVVTIAVIDDSVPEGDESVILTIQPDAAYIIGGGGSLGAQIVENNDANVMLQYMFTGTLTAQVWDTNTVAFSFNATGVGGAFSTTAGYFVSPNASMRASSDSTAATANDAIANGDYMSFTVEPVPGQALSMTNIEFQAVYGNYLFLEPSAASATVFLRSSLDNYAADIGSWTLQPDNVLFPNIWYSINQSLPAAFTNLIGNVTFRLYVYDDANTNQVGVRIDNLYLRGSSIPANDAQQVSLSVADAAAAEPADTAQFTVSRVGSTNSSLVVNYTVAGTAVNGGDYTLLSGTVTIPAGQSSTAITITPIDDELIEPSETVDITLTSGVNYGIIGTSSGSATLSDNGDIGGLIAYLFNEANNGGGSLSNVALATTFQPDKVVGSNAVAGAGLGNFGANNVVGVGHGYATSVPHSGASSIFIRGDYLGNDATTAVSSDDYVSLKVAPQTGATLTLSNFVAYIRFTAPTGETNHAFLRSSADGFTANLGSVVVPGTVSTDLNYTSWQVPLSVSGATSATEFRIYFFNSRSDGTDIVRLDSVAFQGFGVVPPPVQPVITQISVTGSNVVVNFTGGASDPASAFSLQRSATVHTGYADDSSALITGGSGVYQAATTTNGPAQFYRIRR